MMLKDKTILITGAARGLGAEIATFIKRQGGNLILADILENEGQATANALGAKFIHLDLADPKSIETCAMKLEAQNIIELHGLVNNGAIATGIGGIGYQDIELETWDRVMQVNVRGTWLMVKAMAPLLKASKSGRIVNIASDTALWGAQNLLSYVASKGAVISMTRSLAREMGEDNIGVTAIAPGILTTQSTEYVPQHRHDLYEDGRAIKGKQSPENVAAVVAFLLSENALTLTGQLLPANGGFVFN